VSRALLSLYKGGLRKLFTRTQFRTQERRSIRVIPFEPPKEGRLIENYLVDYELGVKNGASYSSSYTVYLYEVRGKGLYLIKEPYLNPEISSIVAYAIDTLSTWLAPSPIVEIDPLGYLLAELERGGFLKGRNFTEEIKAATYYLMRDILGYGIIDSLIRDPEIEDISCEGVVKPVKVWHRRLNSNGWLETNILFSEQENLDAIVARLVHRSNRSVSISSPIIDSVLPEGYRLAATWGREVTSQGSSFNIRKLRTIPYTISELIKMRTMDAKLASYLWLLLEMKGFVIIAGVPASGKTTLLNSLATVLNPNWKIVSIEDTREINLPQSGWKPLHTRYSHSESTNVTLFDLVKLSLRERPDFVVLGESRGEEVQALFQAAASGSGCLTTFHASNTEGMIARMTQPPLSVSHSSLNLIDAVVFMVRSTSGTRYIQEVVEIIDGSRSIFKFNNGAWEGSAEESARLEIRGTGYGHSAKKISFELERRVEFLERLVGKGISSYVAIERELRLFYLNLAF
jgi:flagellar protein FlaI